MFRETKAGALPGGLMVLVLFAGLIGSIWWMVSGAQAGNGWVVAGAAVLLLTDVLCVLGLTIVNPNEAQAVQLLGTYVGTLRNPGFCWVNPLTLRRKVSLRVRNFESAKLKVNDLEGNPIEIAAIVVWKVVDTAEALFHVDNYENFVKVQTEAAVRNLATSYAYDSHVEGQTSLRGHITEVATRLRSEVHDRLAQAGVEVIEARISHLAYAPEIASAMLQRQQASAIVAARSTIVAGAVGMVEMALAELSRKHLVELDDERRAAMVSNLLVVLCSDRHTQPVVNTGTLYS
jgi:regulator of protease activity HflC (stomatin/prohibitin superfamily)